MWLRQQTNGEIRSIRLALSRLVLETAEAPVYLAILYDIGESRSHNRWLEYMAHHDSLTGLPNRLLLLDRLHMTCSIAQRQQRMAALLFVNLDRFRMINETRSHDSSDIVLREASERIQRCVRDSDTVARLGGDEFALILTTIGKGSDADIIAGRILKGMTQPFNVADSPIFLTASCGITLLPDDGTDPPTLLRHAGMALFEAQETGGGVYRFFTPQMKSLAQERLDLERKLREALVQEKFLVFYQPIVDLEHRQVVGAEALLRLEDETGVPNTTSSFLSVAEETNLIGQIGM
ncbi:MAG: hypothetical protein FD149_1824 [Rhodospirillaceae bacterium]|nr:MAG: hypothetical protein FD149_1824 [Rhodospirillaceae bacterium]